LIRSLREYLFGQIKLSTACSLTFLPGNSHFFSKNKTQTSQKPYTVEEILKKPSWGEIYY
jgi:hypothetical protein